MSSCMLSTNVGLMKYCIKLDLCSSRDKELRSTVSNRPSVLPYGLSDSRIFDGGLDADSVDESDEASSGGLPTLEAVAILGFRDTEHGGELTRATVVVVVVGGAVVGTITLAFRGIGFGHGTPVPMILLLTATFDLPLTADLGTGRTKTQSRPFIIQRSHCGLPSEKVHFDF